MPEKKKKLTLFEASSVVAGLGVGGGIMAVPYLASLNGVVQILSITVLAYLVSLLFHLMVAEVVLRDEETQQLVEIFGKYLFIKSWWGTMLMWMFFALIVITFYSTLAAYIVGCSDILHELIGTPNKVGNLITYAVAAGVVFFGLKAIGISEKYAILTIGVLLLIISIGSFGKPFNRIGAISGNVKTSLALFGMLMFSLSCFFSIPQAVEGLSWNRKLVPWAVTIGLGINLVFVLITTVMAVLVSKEVTELAIIGWGKAVGVWASTLGSLFFFLALLTTYWGISYALAIILKERLGWGYRISWLVATLPTLLLAMIDLGGFLGLLRYAGGAMAVLVAVLVVPALRISRKQAAGTSPSFNLGRWGGTVFQLIIIVAYILMAVGSVVSVK